MAVRVEGLNRAVRDLQRAGVEIADIKDVFAEIASEAATIAARYAPVRSGALARSVRGNKAKNKAVVLAGRARVPYAGAINYGWPKRNIKPANFLAKADAEMAERAPKMLEDGVQRIIERNNLT